MDWYWIALLEIYRAGSVACSRGVGTGDRNLEFLVQISS